MIDTSRQLALFGGGLAIILLALALHVGLDWRIVVGALLAYTAIAVLVIMGIGHHVPHHRFGPANSLTLFRASYVALLVGMMAEATSLSGTERWLFVGTGIAALLLDGADGWVARRSGFASPFGARFDMEVDSLLVLALAALVWRAGQAGGWVLTCGLLRYTFVVAGWVWPLLAAPLPPSFRRKAICVAEIIVLLIALAPPVGPGLGGALCLGGLIVLVYSFAADTIQLLATSRREHRAAGMTT